MFLRKKSFYLLIVFALSLFNMDKASAQVELIGGIGTSHFLGDLGGKATKGTRDFSDLNLKDTRFAILGGARVFIGNHVALRGNISYALVTADDKNTTNVERHGRNANFFSNIVEGSAVLELHFNRSEGKGRKRYEKSGGPYLYGGIGMFHFEPKGKLNGEVLKLRELGTEGQLYKGDKKPYKNTSVNVPFGFGYRFKVNNGFLGFEINTRLNFTDYIDDVSTVFPDRTQLFQSSGPKAVEWVNNTTSTIPGFDAPGAIRGNPKDNDGFFFILIKFDYPLVSAFDLGFGQGKRGRGNFRYKKGHCWEF